MFFTRCASTSPIWSSIKCLVSCETVISHVNHILLVQRQILLAVNKLATGHDYYQIGDYEVSPNGELLAYAEDSLSRRLYTIHFKNLKTGEILPDALTGAEPVAVMPIV